jgi:hypothetical protein
MLFYLEFSVQISYTDLDFYFLKSSLLLPFSHPEVLITQ